MPESRYEGKKFLGELEFHSGKAAATFIACMLAAAVVAFVPAHSGLSTEGVFMLFILVFAAGLWITEAIPSFAVALLIMGLEILFLGTAGVIADDAPFDWTIFVAPWAAPTLWLFFGGFVMAEAAHVTGMDRRMARTVLSAVGHRPGNVLFGAMAITFLFSMFMSNTATTAMMVAVMAPVIAAIKEGDPYAKALLLGIPFAANIGGMGTIIGTPPNAIVAGLLGQQAEVSFFRWMLAGVPVAAVLFVLCYFYLRFSYPSKTSFIDVGGLKKDTETGEHIDRWKRLLVLPVFVLTISLWMLSPLHGVPTAVVSFLPVTIFAIAGILSVEEVRRLHWDVLLLLAGGLSLGVGIGETGLAQWMVDQLPTDALGLTALALLFAYMTWLLSNFMSNTAATNILAPIGIALGAGYNPQIVIPLALGASAAMCLPISTPPNAIAYSAGRLHNTDFIRGGLIIGILAPLLATLWLGWLY